MAIIMTMTMATIHTHTAVLVQCQFDPAIPDFPELGGCPWDIHFFIFLLRGAMSPEPIMEAAMSNSPQNVCQTPQTIVRSEVSSENAWLYRRRPGSSLNCSGQHRKTLGWTPLSPFEQPHTFQEILWRVLKVTCLRKGYSQEKVRTATVS